MIIITDCCNMTDPDSSWEYRKSYFRCSVLTAGLQSKRIGLEELCKGVSLKRAFSKLVSLNVLFLSQTLIT